MSYHIKLSNGSDLLDIKPLEGNGLGNVSTLLQVQSVEYKDISFGVTEANRPDAFIVSGDLRAQYLNGTVFTISGNTGYDGTYTVNLTGFNPGDQVAAVVDGQTHIPVTGLTTGSYELLSVAGTKIKVAGVSNAETVFLPGRTLTFQDNSNVPSNGVAVTTASAVSSSVYEATSTNVTANTFVLTGDHRDIFSPADFINVTGTANGLGEGKYKVATVTFATGNTTITLDTAYKALPTGFQTTVHPKITPTIPVAVITLTTPVPVGTTATGSLVPQSPSTYAHALSPAVTSVSPHNYLVTWRIAGTLAAQLVAGTIVQVKNARYNGVRYTTTFAITTVTQTAPSGPYPQGLTEVVMALNDPAVPTPILTTDATSRFVFPVPPAPFGFVSYSTGDVKTSLALTGQGAPTFAPNVTWGNALQSNLVHMVENFASDIPPIAPLKGQTWFDAVSKATRVWQGVVAPIVGVVAGTSGTWRVDAAAADLPAVGETLVVYNNVGLGITPIQYVVTAATQATTPSTSSGFTTSLVISGTIPAAAATVESSNQDAPFGNAYSKKLWKDIVTTSVPTFDFIDMNNNKIINLADATNPQDALNLRIGDARYVNVTGDTMTGNLTMSGSNLALTTGNVTLGATGSVTLAGGNVNVTAGQISLGTSTDGVILANNGAGAPTLSFNTSTSTVTTGNAVINLGQNRIVNLTTPTNALDAANKAYVDSLANGIIWLQPMADPNLFDDSLTAPPAVPEVFTRTYIVPTGATGAWSGLVGRAVTWSGTAWIDVLGRAVAVGDRFGVLINPDNDELSALPPPGGGLTGHAGQIATITGVGPLAYAFYTPHEPDAVSVTGAPQSSSNQVNYSPHFGHSYTFRGTWGTGSYGINYQWIEFAGPQMLVDGAGLRYTGNVLNVGQGIGLTVDADTVGLNQTYVNANWLRRDGTGSMSGLLTLSGAPTAALHAATKGYVDSRNVGDLNDVTVSTPVANEALVFNGSRWVNMPVAVGSGSSGVAILDIQMAASDTSTVITAGTNKAYIRASRAGKLTGVKASLKSASTVGNVVIDVNVNGASILSTKITIEAGSATSLAAAAQPVLSATTINADDLITIDFDAAGANATGVIVTLQFEEVLPTYAIATLTDVTLASPTSGDTLTYNGTNWVNTPSKTDAVSALAITAGVITIDARGDYYTLSLTANVTSIVFTNLPPAGRAKKITLRIRQDATGARTVALPASFKAITGSDTAVQAAANAYTYATIETFDQGTRWEYNMRAIAA